ncbi:MAG: sensor histidine kinase [Bryobacteraceae bacterium]
MYFKRSEVIYPAVALIILLAITLFSLQDWRSYQQSSTEANDTRRILQADEDLVAAITEAESSERGFLLSGEDWYLDTYNKAIRNVPPLLSELETITQKHRAQFDRVTALKNLVPEKMDEMVTTVRVRRDEGLNAALDVVRTHRGKLAMDQIRGICGQIRNEEFAKFKERSDNTVRFGKQTRIVSTLGSGLLVIFIVLSSGALSRAMARREQAIADLHTTLISIADAVVATGLDRKITLINPVALDLTGWREEEALGQPLETVCYRTDGELISKDGRRIPVDEREAPIRNSQGKTIGAVLVFRDITERKQAEDELRRSSEDLQQFAYAASHDLKTPLRTVTNFSQLLVARYQGRLDGDADEFIGFIVNAARQMGQLLDALLEFSRSGEVLDKPRELQAEEVLESALSNLRAEIEETGAEIDHGPLPALVVDELHLRQLFQNLVGNALKYRSERRPKIHVSAEQLGPEWIFSVRDNGMGIEPRHYDRIFGIFKRLHGAEYPGTGIGLATCRRIVERYGGRIWVESQPGEGSTFRFSLRVAQPSLAVLH